MYIYIYIHIIHDISYMYYIMSICIYIYTYTLQLYVPSNFLECRLLRFKDCIAFAVPHKSLGEVVGRGV